MISTRQAASTPRTRTKRARQTGLSPSAGRGNGQRIGGMKQRDRVEGRALDRLRRDTKHVRYAVVGLGHIAQAAVLPAFAHAKRNSRLAALVSDDADKLRTLTRKFEAPIQATYDDYDSLLASGDIDAVYIALPNHLHAEYSIRAARHGVHVLCEKPMAVTVDECRRMIEARDRHRIKMMIAYRLHFEEANLKAVEIAQGRDGKPGQLGGLRYFESAFSFNVKPQNIRTDADKGGGTLFDIGIYCINAARYLFRQEPVEVIARCARRSDDPRFAEIDEMTAAIMRFPNERLATFISSFGAAAVSTYRVVGDKGELCVDNAYEYTEPITHYLTINGGRTKTKTFKKRDQFAPELLYFSECVLHDDPPAPEPSAEEGLIDVQIINALYRSASEGGRPIALDDLPQDLQYPDMHQEIHKRAVREPDLVKVASASEE